MRKGKRVRGSPPVASSSMPVMRRMTWARMGEAERQALCERGLEAIFDLDLKAAIGRIIDDVRANGDEAVCRALHDFDNVSLEPHQLKATLDELAAAAVGPEVDAAIDDAITPSRLQRTADGARRRLELRE